jgi:hypothetical protein
MRFKNFLPIAPNAFASSWVIPTFAEPTSDALNHAMSQLKFWRYLNHYRVLMRNFFRSPFSVLTLASLAVANHASAQLDVAENSRLPRTAISVGINPGVSVAQILASVNQRTNRNDPALAKATAAENLFWLLPLPVGEIESEHPWRAEARQYVSVKFASEADANAAAAVMKTDPRFGWVDNTTVLTWSSTNAVNGLTLPDSLAQPGGTPFPGQVKYQWGTWGMRFNAVTLRRVRQMRCAVLRMLASSIVDLTMA